MGLVPDFKYILVPILLISIFIHLTLSIAKFQPYSAFLEPQPQPQPASESDSPATYLQTEALHIPGHVQTQTETEAGGQAQSSCVEPLLRKEWSAATDVEKSSYIDAVLCLATRPSRLDYRSMGVSVAANVTLYDDFAFVHRMLEYQVHGAAMFLPWHRYFIHIYEDTLHSCGYNGTAMYWDWVKDSDAPSKAKVWSPVNGFGGNGTSHNASDHNSYCVRDGPFTHLRPLFKGNETEPHCLERDFMTAHPNMDLQEMLGYGYSTSVIAAIHASQDYEAFCDGLGGEPHESVHAGIAYGSNGDMGLLTAPNDPIFFLHHTQLDRLWWIWQQENPSNRTMDYGGKNEDGTSATLIDLLPMLGMAPNREVGDFMSTETADLCYRY